MRLLGAKVVEVEQGTRSIEVPFREKPTQQERYFPGALTGAIGDNAGGYAVLTLAPPDREVLTVEYKENFLAPAYGAKLARGALVTAGRRLFICKAEASAEDGDEERVCAAVLQTISPSPVRGGRDCMKMPAAGRSRGPEPGVLVALTFEELSAPVLGKTEPGGLYRGYWRDPGRARGTRSG